MPIEASAALPFAWPAACVIAACVSGPVCPVLGIAGCFGIAAIAAVALFPVLSVVGELCSLGALRD